MHTSTVTRSHSCLKLLLVVANLCNLRYCEHGHDLCFSVILLKIDINGSFMMMHV